MTFALILLSVVCFALNSTVTRAFQIKYPGDRVRLKGYQGGYCLAAATLFLAGYLIGGGSAIESLPALVIFGVLFGLFFFGATWGCALGYELGSMSLTSIILNMSLFIPLVYSCVFLNEPLSGIQAVGILLIALTMILAVERSRENAKGSLRWLMIVLLAFFANGSTAVIQKNYVLSYGEDSQILLMAIAYLCASLLFFGDAAVTAKRRPTETGAAVNRTKKAPLMTAGPALISGLGSFGGNALLGYLCIQVDGAILYPCINGGLCMLCAIVSFAVFKEQPTKRKLIAMATGLCAIVLLNL